MTTEKTAPATDINALASEVMDLWQEHLAVYASDPTAKAELMRLLEPQRQLFADWALMMQNGFHAPGASPPTNGSSASTAADNIAQKARASATPLAPDDGALRLAQLAHRVAELEKRLARLEPGSRQTSAKTPRRSKPSQH